MRIVFLTGVPCSGKTTLALKLIDRTTEKKKFKFGLLNGISGKLDGKDLFIFGDYTKNETFQGTDKLSMAVQPDAQRFLLYLKKNNPECLVFCEGDRLCKPSFLEFCQKNEIPFKLLKLEVDEETLKQRHKARGNVQTEQWKKSKDTSVKNLCDRFEYKVPREGNEVESLIVLLLQ